MRAGLIIAVLAVSFLSSCADMGHRLTGTDIPKVPSAQLVESSLKSVRGRIQSGKVVFSGSIFDALERIRWTERGFKIDGWTQRSVTGTPREATAIYTSPWDEAEEHVAVLHVVAAQIRGTATITVNLRPIKDVEADLKSDEADGEETDGAKDPEATGDSSPSSGDAGGDEEPAVTASD